MKVIYILEDFLGKVRKIAALRKLFGPLYRLVHKNKDHSLVDGLKVSFQIKGLSVLETFDKAMNDNGFKYSLAFGTMLGAVREKGFISHDADIDVFMWIEDYTPRFVDCLKTYGFIFTHSFSVDNDKSGKEDTIMLDGVQIDIFYIYPPLEGRTLSYCCDFVVHADCLSREHSVRKYGGLLPRRIEIPMSNEIVRVPFETLNLPILKNAHEFLACRYGYDYMTPNPNWVSRANPNIIPWSGKVAIFK